jgi:uncharacterized membrane protein YeaQ/YmgE (transglycosylase-associated protein family)
LQFSGWIIIGPIAGFITGKIMKGSGYVVLGDIIVGIIGAVVGGFICVPSDTLAAGASSTLFLSQYWAPSC